MIERIVVPLDGSMTAEAILPQVRRLLYRTDSEVILVKSVLPSVMENGVSLGEAQLAAAREYILGKVEALEQAGVRVKYVVRLGAPAGVILDVVEEFKATMIAMATHGASGVKRVLFGSVAETVIRKSPVPVLLVRPFWSYELVPPGKADRAPIRNLLLPVDGSDLALQALPSVVELAELFETRVVLLRVLEEGELKNGADAATAEAKKQLAALAKTIEKLGVETMSLVGHGDPGEHILKVAGKQGIDLVAMTTHGRTGLARLLTGSVTEHVLRNAKLPILITRSDFAAKKAKKAAKART